MKERSKYWMCGECAKKRWLIRPDFAVTVILGVCGHCNSETEAFLTPVCDFVDPKSEDQQVLD